MKRINLSEDKSAMVDDQDHAWLMAYGTWAYYKKGGYAYTRIHQGGQGSGAYKHEAMHRVIAIKHGIIPDDRRALVDHIDGNKLNNQASNMRRANHSQNGANRPKPDTGALGSYKGVSFDRSKNRYRACIRVNYDRIHLGWFRNARDAALAYNEAATKHFGEFAHLNEVAGHEQ